MSLINDVLRDLDARGAASPLPLPQRHAAAAATRPQKAGRLLLATLVVFAMIASVWWLLQPEPQDPGAVATAAAPQPMAPPDVAAPMDTSESPPVAEPAAPVVVTPLEPGTTASATVEATQDSPAAIEVPAAAVAKATAPGAAKPDEHATTTSTPIVARATHATPDNTRTLQQAATALAQGRDSEAEQLLRELLARDPDATRARQSLAALYQRQGRLDAALTLWRSGLARDSGNLELAEPLARALISDGKPSEAAAVLAAALPPLPQRSDLHALLAYAQQQAGDATRAAATYRALLDHDDSQGHWWLGLAIAEESRGESAAALAAFRRAQAAAGLESSVLRYVEQRIRALAPDRS